MHVRLTFQTTSDGWVGLQVLHISNGVRGARDYKNELEARVLTAQRTALTSERKMVREADKQGLQLSSTGTALVPSQPQLAPLPSLPPLPAVIGGAHQGEKNTHEERSRPRTSFAEDPLALSAISYTTRFVPTPTHAHAPLAQAVTATLTPAACGGVTLAAAPRAVHTARGSGVLARSITMLARPRCGRHCTRIRSN